MLAALNGIGIKTHETTCINKIGARRMQSPCADACGTPTDSTLPSRKSVRGGVGALGPAVAVPAPLRGRGAGACIDADMDRAADQPAGYGDVIAGLVEGTGVPPLPVPASLGDLAIIGRVHTDRRYGSPRSGSGLNARHVSSPEEVNALDHLVDFNIDQANAVRFSPHLPARVKGSSSISK